jgi:hypothetical protein
MKWRAMFLWVLAPIVLLVVSQFICFALDDRANEAFAVKAESMQIKGRTRDYVLSIFGPPSYEYKSDHRTVLVYTPGPALALWRHECKVGFDANGLVDGWAVRTD